jgi:hypothetical protein
MAACMGSGAGLYRPAYPFRNAACKGRETSPSVVVIGGRGLDGWSWSSWALVLMLVDMGLVVLVGHHRKETSRTSRLRRSINTFTHHIHLTSLFSSLLL